MLGPHANSSMDLIQVDTGAVCPDAANEHWNGATGDVKNFQCPRLGKKADLDDFEKWACREGGKMIYRTPV